MAWPPTNPLLLATKLTEKAWPTPRLQIYFDFFSPLSGMFKRVCKCENLLLILPIVHLQADVSPRWYPVLLLSPAHSPYLRDTRSSFFLWAILITLSLRWRLSAATACRRRPCLHRRQRFVLHRTSSLYALNPRRLPLSVWLPCSLQRGEYEWKPLQPFFGASLGVQQGVKEAAVIAAASGECKS